VSALLDHTGTPIPPSKPKDLRASFDLAQTTVHNSNHWAAADSLAARAATSPAVRKLCRQRSRYEADNNSWYSGILQTAANHIVGKGPRLQVTTLNAAGNRKLEAAWKTWCKQQELSEILRGSLVTYWKDGETFIQRTQRPSRHPISLDLRTYEPEQCTDPWSRMMVGDPLVDDGVRIDENTNEVEYYFLDHHPGETTFAPTMKGRWYKANDVIHLWRRDRPGQVRGIPRATSALNTLPIMRRQEMATLLAAETAANLATYLKSTSSALDPTNSPDDFAQIEIAYNMLTTLPAGWDISQVDGKHPGPQYEGFQRQALTSFCRCTSMPYALAAGTSRDSNFSSLKGDMKNVWEPEVLTEQDRMQLKVVEKIWWWFLQDCVYVPGLLEGMPALIDIGYEFFWPPLPNLDEFISARAATERLTSGQTSPSEEAGRRGRDYTTLTDDMARDYGVDAETLRKTLFQTRFGVSPDAPEAGPVDEQTGETGDKQTVQQMALNGAQIASLLEIVTQVSGGLLPADSAVNVMKSAFPSMTDPMIQAILNPILQTTAPVLQDGTPNPAAEGSAPQGEYTELGQRAFNNNLKRINKVLDGLRDGTMGAVLAEQTLMSIGLSPDRIRALMEDAISGPPLPVPEQNPAISAAASGQVLRAANDKSAAVLTMAGHVSLKAAGVPGKPRRFTVEAYDGGPLPVEGFEQPVVVDLETLEYPESIPLLIDHKATVEATLGSTDKITNNGKTISLGGIVTATSQLALGVVEQHDKGQRWQASIGVRIGTLQTVDAGHTVTVNKQTFRGPVLVARNSEMYETSVLPAGADWTTAVNLAAKAASRRLLKGAATMSFEEWLAGLGLDPASISEDDLAALTLAYDASMNPSGDAPPAPPAPPVAPVPAAAVPPVAAAPVSPPYVTAAATGAALELEGVKAQETMLAGMRSAHAAELQRHEQLSTVCKGHPKILATAVSENWSPMQAENAVLKAGVTNRAPSNTRMEDTAPLVLEAAICQARNIPGHEKQYDDQTLQAAHTKFGRAGIGLQQLLLMAASVNGYVASAGQRINQQNLRGVLKAAFGGGQDSLQAAFSTVSLPGIFSNIANKELLSGYEMNEQHSLWKEIAEIKSVSDFKTVTSYRMLDDMTYEELGPGGKIKHGSTGEESYTRSAKTYAKMFSLTREDIINDDMGALDDLRKRLGMGAAEKLSTLFWTEFLDNAAFFTSARGNYITGATTTLLTDGVGLQLGLNAFRNMETPTADGSRRVGGEPQILLLPTELSVVGEQFYKNQNYGGGTTVANSNIYANKYLPLIVPWLSDSSFTNYSSTAWYLLDNPKVYATMVVSFLNGSQQPTVESADADFDTLGVEFRGYHDFGCDKAEYVGAVKSKGAA